MSQLKHLELPDIRETVYATSGRLEATRKYLKTLQNYSSLEAKLLHNKLETDYLRYISSSKQQKQTSQFVCKIHSQAVRNFHDCSIVTTSREKALLSHVHKDLIALYEEKPLNKIMDTRGCRICIDSKQKDPEDLACTLGNLVNKTISYALDIGFQLSPAPSPKDTDNFNHDDHPDIYIPEKSYILPEYMVYVKDYVNTPKENGYQSYHVIVIDSNGDPIEIQFRTYEMNYFSEYKLAEHDKYKEAQIKKYSLPVLDRTKVHWSNYRYETFSVFDEKKKPKKVSFLADDSGLEKSLSIRTLIHNS